MGLHSGLHLSMLLIAVRKNSKIKSPSKIRRIICFLPGALIACYGMYVILKRDFFTYMFLKREFVFLDYGESKILFYFDCFSVMGLCVFIAHYLSKALKSRLRTKEHKLEK